MTGSGIKNNRRSSSKNIQIGSCSGNVNQVPIVVDLKEREV